MRTPSGQRYLAVFALCCLLVAISSASRAVLYSSTFDAASAVAALVLASAFAWRFQVTRHRAR